MVDCGPACGNDRVYWGSARGWVAARCLGGFVGRGAAVSGAGSPSLSETLWRLSALEAILAMPLQKPWMRMFDGSVGRQNPAGRVNQSADRIDIVHIP